MDEPRSIRWPIKFQLQFDNSRKCSKSIKSQLPVRFLDICSSVLYSGHFRSHFFVFETPRGTKNANNNFVKFRFIFWPFLGELIRQLLDLVSRAIIAIANIKASSVSHIKIPKAHYFNPDTESKKGQTEYMR